MDPVTAALQQVIPLAVPATALAAAWAHVGAKGRLTLAALCEQSVVVTVPLDTDGAGIIGEILEPTVQFGPLDIVAGHVAAIGAGRGWPVVTDRGAQLHLLAPGLDIEPLI